MSQRDSHVRAHNTRTVSISPYHPSWPQWFTQAQDELSSLASTWVALHHIGSTAVPQLCAKPIIDIIGVVESLHEADAMAEALESVGYIAMGECGIVQRRFFFRPEDSSHGVPVNLHVFVRNDPQVFFHLLFRDYLRAHPEDAQRYGKLKESLSGKDILSYMCGKNAMVTHDLLAKAVEWGEPPSLPLPRKQPWTQESIVDALAANTQWQMTYFPRFVKGWSMVPQPGDVSVMLSDVVDDTFNNVVGARFSEEEAPQRIRNIIKFYEEQQRPFAWWCGPLDQPQNLTDLLQQAGLEHKEDDIGMFLPLDTYTPTLDKRIDIQRATTLADLKRYDEVMVSIGANPEAFDRLFRHFPPAVLAEGYPQEIYVGRVGGVDVCTGMLVLYAGTAGIYNICTRPEQRRKGYGSAMMQFLIHRAKEVGFNMATLGASAEGKPVYEKLGFQQCCIYREYAP